MRAENPRSTRFNLLRERAIIMRVHIFYRVRFIFINYVYRSVRKIEADLGNIDMNVLFKCYLKNVKNIKKLLLINFADEINLTYDNV